MIMVTVQAGFYIVRLQPGNNAVQPSLLGETNT